MAPTASKKVNNATNFNDYSRTTTFHIPPERVDHAEEPLGYTCMVIVRMTFFFFLNQGLDKRRTVITENCYRA